MSKCIIPGEYNFDGITSAINGEEAYGYVFDDLTPKPDGNFATFNDTDDGSSPAACVMLPATDAAPDGHEKVWHGVVICEGEPRWANLWREA